MRGILAEMGFRQTEPTVLKVDNSGALELSANIAALAVSDVSCSHRNFVFFCFSVVSLVLCFA